MTIIESKNFHPLIYSNPKENIEKLSQEQFNAKLIEKISFIAIAAIGIGVLATFLTTPLTGAVPYILGGTILSTPIIAYVGSSFAKQQTLISHTLEHEEKVEKKLQEISLLPLEELSKSLNPHKITIPQNLANQLKPLIARFFINYEEALELKELSEKMLAAKDIDDRTIKLQSRLIGWQIFEESVIPRMLNAALIAEIIAKPTLQKEWPDLASFNIKSFEERQFDRIYDSNDTYLVFHNSDQKPLTLQEINTHFSIDGLRELCFGEH